MQIFSINFEINKLFIDVDEGEVSNILKKAILRTVELQTCQESFLRKGSKAKDHIDASQYCAQDPNNDQDACRGM